MCEVGPMRMWRLHLEGEQVQLICLPVILMGGPGTRRQVRGGSQVMEDYFLSNRKVHERRSRVMRGSVAVPGQGHQGHRLEWLDRCMCRQSQTHLLPEDGGITSGWVWRERGEKGRGWGNWMQGWEEWGGEREGALSTLGVK